MRSAKSDAALLASLPSLEQIDTWLAEKSLSRFIQQAWPIIEPGREYLHNWHIDAICEHLEAVTAGQILRLVINMPPRYMKSIAVTVCWPTWEWVLRPETRWIFASYAQELSTKHSLDRRIIIQSWWYQLRWGHKVQLTGDSNTKAEFRNTRQGAMLATSLGGVGTGFGGDRLVADDPHNPKKAESTLERETAIRDFDLTFTRRLDDKKRGAIVVVMQRLHHGDLSGHLLKDRGYTHLCLKAEAKERTIVRMPVGRELVREAGDLLWPEREGPVEIEQAKRDLGSYGYSGQYQQEPSPAGGGKFQRRWFKYFEEEDSGYYILHDGHLQRRVMIKNTWRFITADLALSEKEGACYTAIGTWGVTSQCDLLLLDVHRARMEAPDAEDALLTAYRRWGVAFMGVEKAHYGAAICQKFAREGMPLKELIADRDKVVRSLPASVQMENGQFYFRQGAPWLTDYEDELLFFPTGDYDDQVDMTSYAGLVMAEMAIGMKIEDLVRSNPRPAMDIAPGKTELPGIHRRPRWDEVSG